VYSACIPALLADREKGRGAGNNLYVSTDMFGNVYIVQGPAKKVLNLNMKG
jgi:hypothetical protein